VKRRNPNPQALESIRGLRVKDVKTIATWSARLQLIRRCMHCKVTYRDAGAAGKCEKWHEGVNQ
jgi:hypothetical protein